MPAHANPIRTAPASRSVREFVAVLARHDVPYGEPECLAGVLRELHLNKHLAMHFWAAVASLTDKQAARPDAVLASVVEAATGRIPAELRAEGPRYSALVDRLERLLAGQDMEAHELPGLESARVPEPMRAALHAAAPAADNATEDILPIRRPRDTNRARPIRRAALREAATARPNSESRRLVVLPEPPRPAPLTVTEAAAAESRSIPLSSYAEAERRRLAVGPAIFTIAALLTLGASGYYIAHHGVTSTAEKLHATVAAGYGSAVGTWKGDPTPPAPIVNAPAATPNVPSQAASASPQPAAAAPAPVPSANVAAPASQPSTPVAANVQAAANPLHSSSPAALTPAQRMALDAAYNSQRQNPLNQEIQASAVPSGPAVKVPEAAMNAQLLVSRVPVVPEPLRSSGATGVVRLQASINQNGIVSHLGVLDGPAELRRSALEAVSAWRYRPYIVNGQPVDVSTTITVDFSSFN